MLNIAFIEMFYNESLFFNSIEAYMKKNTKGKKKDHRDKMAMK